MEKCYQNFILCGDVDYYCLVCREAFCNNVQVDKHLRWENHRKNIKTQEYIPKYKKDLIYKISDDFYCEICNLVIQSPSDHIKQEYHQNQRSCNKTLKKPTAIKYENGSIKINDKEVSKEQWHGIFKKICFICNEQVNIASHLPSRDHMVKLIQSKIIRKDNEYYRKLGEDKYYCFTCLKPFENSFNIHAEDHKKDKISSKEKKDEDKNAVSYIMKTIMDVYKDTFSYDIKNNMATCYECQQTLKLDIVKLSKHMSLHLSHNKNTCINIDHGKRRAELKLYGRDNFIKLNRGGSMAFCFLCTVCLAPHIKVFKHHVGGAIHKGHLELLGLIEDGKHEKPSQELVPVEKYFSCKIGPFEIDYQELIVMNGGVCIGIDSFLLVRTVVTRKMVNVKCLACDIMLDLLELEGHIYSKEHTYLCDICKVVPMNIKGEDEFIRQIRPGLYHCGFCHKAFPFWENMTRHLQSFSHELQKEKKKLLSLICAKKYVNPDHPLEDMVEYQTLRELNSITN